MDREQDKRYAGDRYDRERVLFEIEDYIGGNVECQCYPIDRMGLTVFLRAKLDAVRNAALDEAKAACPSPENEADLGSRSDYAHGYNNALIEWARAIDALKEPQP